MTNIILPSTLLFSSLLFCQINTEAMRADNLSPGFHQEMNMSFSYISGNSEIMFLRGDYHIDYQSQSDWSGFFVTKYDRALKNQRTILQIKGLVSSGLLSKFFPTFKWKAFFRRNLIILLPWKTGSL